MVDPQGGPGYGPREGRKDQHEVGMRGFIRGLFDDAGLPSSTKILASLLGGLGVVMVQVPMACMVFGHHAGIYSADTHGQQPYEKRHSGCEAYGSTVVVLVIGRHVQLGQDAMFLSLPLNKV